MAAIQKTITPVDGSVYVERQFATDEQIGAALQHARKAQAAWRHVALAERAAICTRFIDAFVARKLAIAEELTRQMGRPIGQSPGEVRGFEERSRHMIAIAPATLADIDAGPKEGFRRFVRREPLGVVLVLAPWNYPYLTSVNSVVPAIMAGNAVILKHSNQTPLCAERFAECFREAGLPDGVFQFLHCTHEQAAAMIASPMIDFVAFTGSVEGGHAVQKAASGRFIGTGLELGGKDPAYVRPDCNLAHAVENLVDGAFFNSGQSCCGIERIYVHQEIYDRFVDGFVALTRQYRLGNPLDPNVNLGPMVRTRAAEFARGQVREAVAAGARSLVDPQEFPADKEGTPYMAPQVLVDVNHSMRIMREESFAPVIGIMKVQNDEQAIALMNDSDFGLTAAIWTTDPDAALRIGDAVETGTWFMNRCDYLDPALAWTGVKDSGRGCTLSRVGYEQLTRPKSYHLRIAI
ncbi:MAG: aldehyde dehydrogenase family protein [Gammaproteobacteria bacterium]|nr:aldehyde dehydrogenase family protein [Gammaproteobacteria bacterium]MCG3143345.1 Succinate-semialdehyde dehydrogenase [NADP(+)] 1 [Gammaproteobacteria bacterium]